MPHPSLSSLKVLVTGASGFAGYHLLSFLQSHHTQVLATYCHRQPEEFVNSTDIQWLKLDLSSCDSCRHTEQRILDFKPDFVMHLGARSNVPLSFQEGANYFDTNVSGTLRLIEILKRLPCPPLLLFISTGNLFNASRESVIDESTLPAYDNPYALTKHTVEKILPMLYPNYLIARPFNHSGKRQHSAFFLPSICSQVAHIARKAQPSVLHVGNLNVFKSFLHIDDVITAYMDILLKGTPGEIYHIASSEILLLEEIVHKLSVISNTPFDVVPSTERIRQGEVSQKTILQTHKMSALGWSPKINIDQLLKEMYDFYISP